MTTSPSQQFETIYRTYQRQVTTHIANRLFRTDPQLTEDLAAETFLRLWRTLADGTTVRHPRALLALIADRAISDHFRRRPAWETATDFTATIATEIATGPADAPHLAELFAELEAAKDELARVAQAYKGTNHPYTVACSTLSSAGSPQTIARAQERWQRAKAARAAALEDFRTAAERVAAVGAEWNAAAAEHTALGAGRHGGGAMVRHHLPGLDARIGRLAEPLGGGE